MGITFGYELSKPIECTAPRVNRKLNYRFTYGTLGNKEVLQLMNLFKDV